MVVFSCGPFCAGTPHELRVSPDCKYQSVGVAKRSPRLHLCRCRRPMTGVRHSPASTPFDRRGMLILLDVLPRASGRWAFRSTRCVCESARPPLAHALTVCLAQSTNAALTHIAGLIEDIPAAMLTTVEADRALASRPMAALQMDAQGALWFFTDTRSSKVEHLDVVNLSFTDASNGTYVSLSGRGEISTERSRIQMPVDGLCQALVPGGPRFAEPRAAEVRARRSGLLGLAQQQDGPCLWCARVHLGGQAHCDG